MIHVNQSTSELDGSNKRCGNCGKEEAVMVILLSNDDEEGHDRCVQCAGSFLTDLIQAVLAEGNSETILVQPE